ncbi:MbcA/ParS/Xre antitoxin family protein [Terasakiella pusilla]|uniref:MbcA/ParS/Xre antitoxin family protein n=1 Tax=Terasakiella pusilla TaxID=64973 RepID=UPI003AA8CCCD
MSLNSDALSLPAAITEEDCARLSGPGLKAFRHITTNWGLGTNDQVKLLGQPSRSTYYRWLRKQRSGERLVIPYDVLMRISAVLNIHRSLIELFPVKDEALTWLIGSHFAPVFGGRAPLAVLLEDEGNGIDSVARYLNAWRFGEGNNF